MTVVMSVEDHWWRDTLSIYVGGTEWCDKRINTLSHLEKKETEEFVCEKVLGDTGLERDRYVQYEPNWGFGSYLSHRYGVTSGESVSHGGTLSTDERVWIVNL